MRKPPLSKIAKFEAGNAEAAAIILEDPARFAGGALEWARLFMERAGGTEPAPEEGQYALGLETRASTQPRGVRE